MARKYARATCAECGQENVPHNKLGAPLWGHTRTMRHVRGKLLARRSRPDVQPALDAEPDMIDELCAMLRAANVVPYINTAYVNERQRAHFFRVRAHAFLSGRQAQVRHYAPGFP